jgi:glycosyltransferase involved in cell wall biosynthesis
VHVIPNGVNTERFRPDQPPLFERSAESFTVGFVGTLKPWHGLPVLARAFGELHRKDGATRLLVGGDGPERSSFEAELRNQDAFDATTFAGAVSASHIPNLLASLDAAVAPYPAEANFYFSPLKVFEYMASGLPIVASAIGQIAEVIEHRVTGILCPPGDSGAIADALLELRQTPALGKKLGGAARERALSLHTWDGVVDRILALGLDGVDPAGVPHPAGASVA